MALPSLAFAYFFVLVFTGAWALRGDRRARNGLLLAASYGFYASWDLHLAGWLLAVSLLDWACGQGLHRAAWSDRPRLRRALVAGGVLANVGLLAALKLYDFFRQSLAEVAGWLGLEAHLPVLELLAPVGLSFYTFQGIAYLVDCLPGQGRTPGQPGRLPAVHGLLSQAAGRAHLPLGRAAAPAGAAGPAARCPTRSGPRRWCCRG